jgi:hypothetical protein
MITNRWAVVLLVTASSGSVLLGAGGAAGQGAVSPHGPSLDMECSACHTTDGWTLTRSRMAFSHASTGFRLQGAHERVACESCHLGLRFDEPAGPVECASCHADVHQGRLSSQCEDCHQPESWRGERERIMAHSRTSFPLAGAHLRLDCEACHRDERAGAYTGLDPACWSCHADDYRGTNFPEHEAMGYDRECRNCHGTATWRGARFDHVEQFPLIGAHATAPCATCHRGQNREVPWTPADENDCVACHRVDYDRAHPGVGYPLDCTACHTVEGWDALSFDHDGQFFPIYSGSHRGRWDTCVECHPSTQNFGLFTCITCHRQSSTDNEHNEVRNYVYESTACLSCHPRGRGEGD